MPVLASSSQLHFSNGMEQNVFSANFLNVAFTVTPLRTSQFVISKDTFVPHSHSNWLFDSSYDYTIPL